MKAKKATKDLKKAQSLLSAVVEKWIDITPEAQELLTAAKDSVRQALAVMGGKRSLGFSSKAEPRHQTGHNSAERRTKKRFTDEARKKLSILAKKRWAVAKSRGARSLAG
ncbi:MAG TPA: hypothetical protein VG860_22575 [Terriglobia bacterium]|jgi:hypothetical protein|nr:hypothetical protein [Terriglobia bacterium]